ncbi:arginine kinase, partial [Striga asiatica]
FTLGIEDNSGLIRAYTGCYYWSKGRTVASNDSSTNELEQKPVTTFQTTRTEMSQYAVVVVYVNEDNIEPIMPMEETNTSVRPYALGKEVVVEEQLTPTAHKLLASMVDTPSPTVPEKEKRTVAHKLLASMVDTPSPTAPEKEKRTVAKRSIDFQLQTGSASNRPEVSYDDSIQESTIGTSSKRQKKDT